MKSHPPDRAGRHPAAEPQRLAVDALVAPPRVLASEPDDQLLYLVGDWRSTLGGGQVDPAPGHHGAVPAQQRRWAYQKARPARPWEQPAQRREQRPVGGLQAGPVAVGGAAPGSRARWRLPTDSRARSTRGCGVAPGRRMTRPRRPPPTKASKRRRIVALRQAEAAGHRPNRLLAPHVPSSCWPSGKPASRTRRVGPPGLPRGPETRSGSP
jgi:hypothetical protein